MAPTLQQQHSEEEEEEVKRRFDGKRARALSHVFPFDLNKNIVAIIFYTTYIPISIHFDCNISKFDTDKTYLAPICTQIYNFVLVKRERVYIRRWLVQYQLDRSLIGGGEGASELEGCVPATSLLLRYIYGG